MNRLHDVVLAYGIFFGNPDGKRPLERPRRRWKDNTEIGWEGVDWIELAESRKKLWAFVNTVMNVRVPVNAGRLVD